MTKELKLSTDARNTTCDALAALMDGATMSIYDGAMPASPQTAVSGQVLLAELTMGSPAFDPAVAGIAAANAITGDTSANNSGTAAWARIIGSSGVMDCNVGIGADDRVITFANKVFIAGGKVDLSAFTLTVPE
ncbi:MAG: hypothetical protein V7727_15520 [Sneathiella sp.]